MSESYIGEIMLVGFTYAPRNWAFCDGQLLSISSNTALFSLLGTIYGGDGRTTFALPDLRGRQPVHKGQGPGLADYREGQRSGSETVTLTAQQMPSHTHLPRASGQAGTTSSPAGAYWAAGSGSVRPYHATPAVPLGSAVQSTGGSQSHENMAPYLTLSFIICLQGIYPSRN